MIDEVIKGGKKSDIAKKYEVPLSTLSSILKQSDKILVKASTGENVNIQKIRKVKDSRLEDAILTFVQQCRRNIIPISGAIIKQKALQYAGAIGVLNFKASEGWLTGFKKRHNIIFKKLSGEGADANLNNVEIWMQNLPSLLKDFDADNIYNIDETALFYRCFPDKTMDFKSSKCVGGKYSKERITVLVGANSTGSKKLPLLVIGKAKQPRCFKNVRSLPVKYKANAKAWMTSEIFESYLLELDQQFTAENQKVYIFFCFSLFFSCITSKIF